MNMLGLVLERMNTNLHALLAWGQGRPADWIQPVHALPLQLSHSPRMCGHTLAAIEICENALSSTAS